MKSGKKPTTDILKILTAIFISVLMCFCMCACGDEGSAEETVEITTPSEETAQPDKGDNVDLSSGGSGDESDADAEGSGDTGKYKNEYEKIYKECNAEMKKATDKYVDELKNKSSSVSKSDLYDQTQDRIEKLKKIYDKAKSNMVDAMLASTADDEDAYKKYFNKMTQAYTDFSREITAAYTDSF